MSVRLAIGDRLAVRSALPDRLFVRLDVEVDEQAEVARQKSTAKERSALRAGTGAPSRELAWPVRRDEVRVS